MYKAEEREVFVKSPEGKMIVSPKYKAIVNPTTESPYAILSKDYTILPHEDVLSKVLEEIGKNPEYGQYKMEGPFFYNEGARMEVNFTFPEVSIPITKGDLVHPQIKVLNGYDGNWGYHLIFGAFRVVCSNGLTIGEKVLELHRKHYKQLPQIIMNSNLGEAMNQFSTQTNIWKQWVDKVLEEAEIAKKIEALKLSKKREEEIRYEVEVSDGVSIEGQKRITQWILFNILCQYATHRVSPNIRLELSRRLRKIF